MNFHTNDKYEYQIIWYVLVIAISNAKSKNLDECGSIGEQELQNWFLMIPPNSKSPMIQIQSNSASSRGWFPMVSMSSGMLVIWQALHHSRHHHHWCANPDSHGRPWVRDGDGLKWWHTMRCQKYSKTIAPVSEEQSLGINSGMSTKSFRFECDFWT